MALLAWSQMWTKGIKKIFSLRYVSILIGYIISDNKRDYICSKQNNKISFTFQGEVIYYHLNLMHIDLMLTMEAFTVEKQK